MIKIVQSFRGKGGDDKWLVVNGIIYVLSSILCKKHGYETKMYCDDTFWEYIKDIAKYDEVSLEPNHYPTPPEKIYADVKFRCMENEPIGAIHMDGDVLLFNHKILGDLWDEDWDVLVQCEENEHNIKCEWWKSSSRAFSKCLKPNWAADRCRAMYNCGVVCIRNEKLKKVYFDTYWKMYKEFEEKGLKDLDCVPDIIIEQQYLLDLCKLWKLKVKFILPGDETMGRVAREKGYTHLIGGKAKYTNITNVLKVIYKYDKEAYIKLKERFYDREILKRKWPY